MKRPVKDGISLLVGAGVGMTLMYLLDPAEGLGRRKALQKAARDRLAQASNAASAGFGHLQDAVDHAAYIPGVQHLAARAADAAKGIYNDVSSRAGATANEYQNQASEAAHGLGSKLSGHLNDLRSRAGDLTDSAKAQYGDWLRRSTLAAGRDEDHHYIGQTACALSSLALGAGAVYLFDPENGHKRRTQIIDRSMFALRETGDFFRKTGRRLVSRGRVLAEHLNEHAMDTVHYFRPTAPVAGAQVNESTEASMGT